MASLRGPKTAKAALLSKQPIDRLQRPDWICHEMAIAVRHCRVMYGRYVHSCATRSAPLDLLTFNLAFYSSCVLRSHCTCGSMTWRAAWYAIDRANIQQSNVDRLSELMESHANPSTSLLVGCHQRKIGTRKRRQEVGRSATDPLEAYQ